MTIQDLPAKLVQHLFFTLVPVAIGFLLGVLIGCGESSTAYQAHLQIKTGTAQRYSQEAYERHDTLEAAKGTDALVDAYTEQPYMICMDDITEDAEDWRNQNLLAYFELKSVALKKQ